MSGAGPQVNGVASPTGKYIDHIDPDDPEYIKNLQRPAEVKEDLQQMENRSRVKLILNSQAFKEELEQVVEEQLRNGPFPTSLIALQQITDLLLPHSKGGLGSLARASAVIPINDLRGVESQSFAKGERLLRCKLAALYRLVDLCGWSHGIYNHITARVSSENEHFLLNPFGLTYSEVTASTLIKVDVNGEVVDQGSTQLGSYKAGFLVHAAIHQARPDIKCIVHLHTPAAVAVSALKCGLLPMSQEALLCGHISYHDFQGVSIDVEEREKLARNLGVHNKVLILRNRGVLSCGETVEEAFHYTFNVMAACESQVKAIPLGLDNIVIPSEEAREQAHKVASHGSGSGEAKERKWKTGELEFEALMRTLDNSGYRTGYPYKMPVIKQERKERSNSEVEIPPSSSSFTYIFDGDYLHSKYASPIQAAKDRQKIAFKAGWLTTPNAYKKTEIDEIGTTTPKKITRWVSEGDSPGKPGSASIKIENPNQFAPQGVNPKEYKEKQKSIKKDYYEEKVTAGPQSKILEGITWDEAQKAKDGQLSGAGDQLIVVGAASKGIIQRDHQHNAVVYRQYYAANPFENMSEAEIEQYQAEVQRKERGEPEVEEEPVQPQPIEVPAVQQPQEPEKQDTEVVELARLQWDANGQPEMVTPSWSSTGYHTHEEELETHIVDKVISAEQHILDVQEHMGADHMLQHHQFSNPWDDLVIDTNLHKCLEGDILNNFRHSLDVNCGGEDDCVDNLSSEMCSHNSSRATRGESRNLQNISWSRRLEAEIGSPHVMNDHETETSHPEDDLVTVQLNPIQLYHGRSESGVMKVRFSIQSTVRRTIRAELSRGGEGCIEEVCSSISEPFIEHFPADDHCFEQPEGLNAYIHRVNVRKKWRRVRQPPGHNQQQTSVLSQPTVSNSESETRADFDYSTNVSTRCFEQDHTDLGILPDVDNKIDDLPGRVDNPGGSLVNTGEIVRLNSRQEIKGKQTPNVVQASGGEGRRSGQFVREKSSARETAFYDKLTKDSGITPDSYRSTQSGAPGRNEETFDKIIVTSGHLHYDDLEDDIKFADEGTDEDFDPVKVTVDVQPDTVQVQTQPTFQQRDNSKKKLLDRKQMPPPPLPPLTPLTPLLKSRISKPKKKKSLRQKVKQTYPALSPVKEEFGGTVEEMEEMEAIIEDVDDSFEQLLISAEDDLLISPKTEQDPNSRRFTVRDVVGAAPMALEDDFGYQDTKLLVGYNDDLLSLDGVMGYGQTDVNYPSFAGNSVSVNLPSERNVHNLTETLTTISKDNMAECSSDDLEEGDSTFSAGSQGESDDERSEDEDRKPTNPKPLNVAPSLVPVPSQVRLLPEVSMSMQLPSRQTQKQTGLPIAAMAEDLLKENNLDKASRTEREIVKRIPHPEISNADLSIPSRKKGPDKIYVSSEKGNNEILDITPKLAETNTSTMPPTKHDSNQGIIPAGPLLTSPDESFPVLETEAHSHDTIPSRETEADIHDTVPYLRTETNSDVISQSRETQRQVDNMPPKETDNNFNVISHHRRAATNIVPSKETEIVSSGIKPTKKIETGIYGIIPHKKRETETDDVIPSKRIETEIYDIIPNKRVETNIDDIIPNKRVETNIDDISPSKKMETEIDDIIPHKNIETDIDDIIPHKKIETEVDDIIPSKKVELNVETICPKVSLKNEESTSGLKQTDKLKHINRLNVDEGPVQTSSPKMGRAKSKESPFKPYLQKLGKSEETLLDIMPLEGQKPQIVAKSQELLENTTDDGCVKSQLLRSKSLGPHHVNRKKQTHFHTKSKETLIDDFLDSRSAVRDNFQSPRAVLDEFNLMKHSERMKLSSAKSIFKPSIIPPGEVVGDVMSPLPDTTEVPSVSDGEGQSKSEDFNQSPSSSLRTHTSREHNPESSESLVPKQRWVPKQKRERRIRRGHAGDEPENVIQRGFAKDRTGKREDIRSGEHEHEEFTRSQIQNSLDNQGADSRVGDRKDGLTRMEDAQTIDGAEEIHVGRTRKNEEFVQDMGGDNIFEYKNRNEFGRDKKYQKKARDEREDDIEETRNERGKVRNVERENFKDDRKKTRREETDETREYEEKEEGDGRGANMEKQRTIEDEMEMTRRNSLEKKARDEIEKSKRDERAKRDKIDRTKRDEREKTRREERIQIIKERQQMEDETEKRQNNIEKEISDQLEMTRGQRTEVVKRNEGERAREDGIEKTKTDDRIRRSGRNGRSEMRDDRDETRAEREERRKEGDKIRRYDKERNRSEQYETRREDKHRHRTIRDQEEYDANISDELRKLKRGDDTDKRQDKNRITRQDFLDAKRHSDHHSGTREIQRENYDNQSAVQEKNIHAGSDISRSKKPNERSSKSDGHMRKRRDTDESDSGSNLVSGDSVKANEKELSPVDKFLNSNRMDIDPEGSPRLHRRRGGAIAYPDKHDRRKEAEIAKVNKIDSKMKQGSQEYKDDSLKKRGGRKRSESDSKRMHDKENRHFDEESGNIVTNPQQEPESTEKLPSRFRSNTSPAAAAHFIQQENSKMIPSSPKVDSFGDEPPTLTHPHLRESIKSQQSIERDNIVDLPFPDSGDIQETPPYLNREKRPRSTNEKHTKDGIEKIERGKKDEQLLKAMKNKEEVTTSAREKIAKLDESLNSSNFVNTTGDLEIGELINKAESDRDVNRKYLSRKEIKSDEENEILETSNDERRKVEDSQRQIGIVKRRLRSSSDEDEIIEDGKHQNKNDRKKSLHASETVPKTRRDSGRCLSVRTRSSGDDTNEEDNNNDDRGVEKITHGKDDGSRSLKFSKPFVRPKEDQSHPARRDRTTVNDIPMTNENESNLDPGIEKRYRRPDLSSGIGSRLPESPDNNKDSEIPESLIRVQGKQKYAGFVRRTGRSARKSHPMKNVSLNDSGMEEEHPDESYEETLAEPKSNRQAIAPRQHDSNSEDDTHEFGSLIHDNPIEVNMDDSTDGKPTRTRRSILSLFSCVSGKSSGIPRRTDKQTKKRSTAYYEEGEKRKIKKVSRQKDKKEKSSYYFEESGKDQESRQHSGNDIETLQGKVSQVTPSDPHAMPEVRPSEQLPSIPRSEKYQKKIIPIHPSKPVLKFVDPEEALDSLEGEISSDDDNGSHSWNNARMTNLREEPGMFSRTKGGELNSFSSFGKANISAGGSKPVMRKYGRDRSAELETVSDTNDLEQITKTSSEETLEAHLSNEDSEHSSEGKHESFLHEKDIEKDLHLQSERHAHLEQSQSSREQTQSSSHEDSEHSLEGKHESFLHEKDIEKDLHLQSERHAHLEQSQSSREQSQSSSPEVMETDNTPHVPEIRIEVDSKFPDMSKSNGSQADLLPKTFTGMESFEKPLDISNDLAPPITPEKFDSSDEYPTSRLNSSAPAHFSIGQQQTLGEKLAFGPAHDEVDSFNESHQFDASYDHTMSFDATDLQHRRNLRTVSFDDSFHPLQRHISETSIGTDSMISRPRSASSTSNPLIYEPWRAKADKKKRSMSISEMVYAKGGARPARTRSVGEICNSTVASSVARRRARTRPSSDITSRMYQPRHHNRSHSSLGNTSFGSVHPARQRSFSGFDHSTRSSDASVAVVKVKRSESDRQPSQSPQMVKELERKIIERSKSDRHQKLREELDDKPISPLKSDTIKSTDSASGGETLEERSSKEGSPTKEHLSPTKEKKKKKKFHIPSFSKKKSKESKESAA